MVIVVPLVLVLALVFTVVLAVVIIAAMPVSFVRLATETVGAKS